jgi:hypothetical protein
MMVTSAQRAEADRLMLDLDARLRKIGPDYAPAALMDAIMACGLPSGALRMLSRSLDREADRLEREN